MPKQPRWKNNLNLPTEEEALEEAELIRAARDGNRAAIEMYREKEARRRKGLPDHYDKLVIDTPDGNKREVLVMAPYYQRRPSLIGSARMKGVIAASVMAVLSLIIFVIPSHSSAGRIIGECIADILIIIGTFFTAQGAFLGVSGTHWLQELAYQHRLALNQQKNPRRSEVTRQLIEALDGIRNEMANGAEVVPALDKVKASLLKDLYASSSGFSHIQVLTNRDIAELFLDASQGAVLGSILIIGGTLVLAVLALHGS